MELKSRIKDEKTLAKVVDQGINQGAGGHFTVGGDLCAAAEGEEVVDLFVLQGPVCDGRGKQIVGDHVTDHDLHGEARHQLHRMGPSGKYDVLTAQIPNQTAQTVVDNGRYVLTEAANVVQEEHQRRAKYEIQNADHKVERKRTIYHLLDSFHITTKIDRITRIIP